MAISFIAKTHVIGSLTGSEPAGTTSGDLLVAHVVGLSDHIAHVGPAGWTQIFQQDNAGAGDCRGSAWWIARGGSAPSFVWTGPLAVDGEVTIETRRGADTTSPIDGAPGATNYNAGGTAPISPSVTTANANSWLVSGFFDGGAVAITTKPTGMTSRQETDGGTSFLTAVADLLVVAAGATGTKTWTLNAGDNGIAYSFAIKLPGSVFDPTTVPPPPLFHPLPLASIVMAH